MSSQRDPGVDWVRGDRCGAEDNCPSKRYYWNEDGQKVCSRGHVQQGVVQTVIAEDDFAAQSSQGRVTRLRKESEGKKSRFYTGVAALNLFLSCYQHILRLQCKALIVDKGFPEQLEGLVKDLWELRLPRIQDEIGSHLKLVEETDDDDEEDAIGPKLYSSQTESTGGETDTDGIPRRERRRELPSMVDSLALCYMALMLLRCPINSSELHNWAVREEIPFVRPLRHLDKSIKRNLAQRWINLLETHHALQRDDLDNSIRRLMFQYYRHFELSLPPLNYQPLLFWYIHELAIPLSLYTTVQQLATLTGVKFTFPRNKPRRSLHSPLPELRLAALLVISTKLYHPFDNSTYYARSETDSAFLKFSWSSWSASRAAAQDKSRSAKPFLPGEQMYVSEQDVFSLSPEQLDSYMDWFATTWDTSSDRTTAMDSRRGQLPPNLLAMFPTHLPETPPAPTTTQQDDTQLKREAKTERLEALVASLEPRPVISDEKASTLDRPVKRLGSEYRTYKSEDLLDGYAREFHEAVAERAAVSLERLLAVVRDTEWKLFKWKKRAGQVAKGKGVEGDGDGLRGAGG